MAITVRSILSDIRGYLGRPDQKRVPDHEVLLRLWDKQSFYNKELKLTRENWMVNRFFLTVDPGINEKPINPPDGDFGEAFLIETFSDSDSNLVRREVPIVPYQDIDRFYEGPNTEQGSGGQVHVAAAFAPFNLQGQWNMAWYPKHSQSAIYRTWYTPEGCGQVSLEGNLRFPMDDLTNLVKVDTALTCFPMLIDEEQKELTAKQKEIKDQLNADRSQYYPTFETARHQMRREHTGRRGQWGSGRNRRGSGSEWL